MDIQITSKNVEVPQSAQDYIERKLGKLARHLPAANEFKVEISQERTKSPGDRFVVQVTVNSAGSLLRGESRAVNMLTAVDEIAKVITRQAERFKGRLQQRGKVVSLRRLSPPEEAPTIARVKSFPVQPLAPEDAAEQMEMLGHSFFLFLNPETGSVNLIYRRQDGRYGLIEPTVS